MHIWTSRIRLATLALFVGATLTNCGGGGGGSGRLQLFFGMNNDESCSTVVVEVNADDAHAIFLHEGDDLDCDLEGALEASGCDVQFSELDGGNRIRVTINGCSVPAVTNLFSCAFGDFDLDSLIDETDAQCVCSSPPCDQSPPLCIDEDANPRSCENCNNGVDDDDNGLEDCDDPNCEHSDLCDDDEPTTTTSDTTTSTTDTTTTTTLPPETTTTMSPTTTVLVTTTTLPPPGDCNLVFRLTDAVEVGSLEFTTDTPRPGRFAGSIH